MSYLPRELGLEEELARESTMSAFTHPPPLGIASLAPLGLPPYRTCQLREMDALGAHLLRCSL